MLDDVTIVAWGEFGRTPRIDPAAKGGRHHWPQVGPAFLAGGGLRTGQVIGATDRLAGEVVARPVSYQDVMATLYFNLGIDAATTTLVDPTGRPQYLLDRGTPIREGDRLLMLYASANRDESVFGPDAEDFRAQRDATRHVAFGFGEHFCLGAQLARMEARLAFTELLGRFTGWELAGRVRRLPSLFMRGIVQLPLTLS